VFGHRAVRQTRRQVQRTRGASVHPRPRETPCPNEGVAVELGHHKRPDLVVAASFDENGTAVLTNFQPVANFPAVIQPEIIRTGVDFNGDGRQDIIEASFQTSTMITLTRIRE
jgi:hypothetical protein